MLPRIAVFSAALLLLTVPASGINFNPITDQALRQSEDRLKEKDYRGAHDAALRGAEGGMRDLVVGLTAAKLERWEEASSFLAKAASGYPLLGDYAYFYRAKALFHSGNHEEALDSLKKLAKGYPESPLIRQSDLLRANILFAQRDYKGALAAYQGFIEQYASGEDAQTALMQTAACKEESGDKTGAVLLYRNFWLTNPASSLASRAEENLKRLAAAGIAVTPFTAEELLKRGAFLFDLKKFDLALKALESVPAESLSAEAKTRLKLKTAQTLMKVRRYREAEKIFAELLPADAKKEATCDIQFLHAKALDKSGREIDALDEFLIIAGSYPDSPLADDALLDAAFILKSRGKKTEALTALDRLLKTYPGSTLRQRALWETAWIRYNMKDYAAAADTLKSLQKYDDQKERSLYWLGRTLDLSGDKAGSQSAYAALVDEFPYGYYALQHREETGIKVKAEPLPFRNLADTLPLPAGYDRIKALIFLGFYDDARKEITAAKKKALQKPKAAIGIARLYLEMEDYNGALTLFQKEKFRSVDRDTSVALSLTYPRAYTEIIAADTARYRIPEDLVLAVIRAESAFHPGALSHAGAMGLMQLMPATARSMTKPDAGKFNVNSLTVPKTNIGYGVRHLRDLLSKYKGDQIMAIAAYNAGSSNVDRWRKSFGVLKNDEFIESIPFAETREYVKKVLANAAMYRRLYGIGSSTQITQQMLDVQSAPEDITSPPETDAPVAAPPSVNAPLTAVPSPVIL